mgnify:CR=1 FL=1
MELLGKRTPILSGKIRPARLTAPAVDDNSAAATAQSNVESQGLRNKGIEPGAAEVSTVLHRGRPRRCPEWDDCCARASGVMVEDKLDEDNLNKVGRVDAPAVVLERPAVSSSVARPDVGSPNWVHVDRRNLTRDA